LLLASDARADGEWPTALGCNAAGDARSKGPALITRCLLPPVLLLLHCFCETALLIQKPTLTILFLYHFHSNLVVRPLLFDPFYLHSFNKSDPNFAEKIRHIRDPKMRMGVVWAHCKTKMICEPDEPKEEGADPEVEELKKGHGGCGHAQPQIRKEGLKMFVQYKKTKDDDDVCFKLTFFSFKIYLPRRRSSHCSLTRG
jgi:hypothetical protein